MDDFQEPSRLVTTAHRRPPVKARSRPLHVVVELDDTAQPAGDATVIAVSDAPRRDLVREHKRHAARRVWRGYPGATIGDRVSLERA